MALKRQRWWGLAGWYTLRINLAMMLAPATVLTAESVFMWQPLHKFEASLSPVTITFGRERH